MVHGQNRPLKPVDMLQVQLLPIIGNSGTQILMHSPECGDRINAFHPPIDEQTTRLLYNIFEMGYLDQSAMTAEECVALANLGVTANQGLGIVLNQVGKLLYSALFPFSLVKENDLCGGFQIALRKAREKSGNLLVQLKFGDPSVVFARLPWELLCDENEPLLVNGISFSRYITMGEAVPSIQIQDRLEVLLIVSRPTDLIQINKRSEQSEIENALKELEKQGKLRLTVLNPPTFEALEYALQKGNYHIIHFDGHGQLVWKCSKCSKTRLYKYEKCGPDCGHFFSEESGDQIQGRLAFEASTPERKSDLVDQEKLGLQLKNNQVPLFFASACQTATLSGRSIFNSISSQLIRSGIPAVVGMQYSIPVDASVKFASNFYTALAQGKPLPDCVKQGRLALYFDQSVLRPTWYIPVLYLREIEDQGRLFRLPEETNGILIGEYNNTSVYFRYREVTESDWEELHADRESYPFLRSFDIQDKAVFFGREEFSDLLANHVKQNKLTILTGTHGFGKTSLVNAGLIPKLLDSDHLVLSLNGYTNPPRQLRDLLEKYLPQAIPRLRESKEEIPVEKKTARQAAQSLCKIIDAAMQAFEHPVTLVLDELDQFLARSNALDCRALGAQIQECVRSGHPQSLSLLLVIGNPGLLDKLELLLPEVFQSRIELKALTIEEARKAIVDPLHLIRNRHVTIEPKLVERLIKHDLCTTSREEPARLENNALVYTRGMDTETLLVESINPVYLQVVCYQLYRAALQADKEKPEIEKTFELWIGEDLYNNLDAAKILKKHLESILKEGFVEPVRRSQARQILKTLVNPSGSQLVLTTRQVADLISFPQADVEAICMLLENENILNQTTNFEGEPSYRLSHVLLAREVSTWFDREQAIILCAQDTLNRVWNSWKEEWQVHQKPMLAGPDQLREIAQRRKALDIHPGQLALLLRSAIHHHVCMDFWVGQFLEDPTQTEEVNRQARKGRELLNRIQTGGAAPGLGDENIIQEEVQALGLDETFIGQYGLARAAISHPDKTGVTRHVAALGLGILGVDQVRRSLSILTSPPGSQFWRGTQALAQIRTAGLVLPSLPPMLWLQVAGWWAGIRTYAERFRILTRLVATSLLTGWGLLTIAAVIFLLCKVQDFRTIYSFFLIGSVFGILYALGFSLLDGLFHTPFSRITGGVLGMLLCVPAFAPYLRTTDIEKWFIVLAKFGLFCFCIGVGASLGLELDTRLKPASSGRLGLGLSALFCAGLFFLLYFVGHIETLFLLKDLLIPTGYPRLVQQIIESSAYPAAGGVIGAALTGGILTGEALLKFLNPHHL